MNLRLCKKQIEMWCGWDDAEEDKRQIEMGLKVVELHGVALHCIARCDVRLKRLRMTAQLACGGIVRSPSHLRKILQIFGYIFWVAQREAAATRTLALESVLSGKCAQFRQM